MTISLYAPVSGKHRACLWFTDHDVEADVVGEGAPLHPLVAEDHDPGHKPNGPYQGAKSRQYDILLDGLLPFELLASKTFSEEPNRVDQPDKRQEGQSNLKVLAAQVHLLLVRDLLTR